jgi:TM2 domain.
VTSLALKASLTDRELALLSSEMPNRAKSLAVAFLLWFFLGTLGIYHFYLGNKRRGWLMTILTVVGFVTLIVLIGFVILIGLIVVWIIDAVRMSTRVQQVNAGIESGLISEIIAGRSAAPAPAQ